MPRGRQPGAGGSQQPFGRNRPAGIVGDIRHQQGIPEECFIERERYNYRPQEGGGRRMLPDMPATAYGRKASNYWEGKSQDLECSWSSGLFLRHDKNRWGNIILKPMLKPDVFIYGLYPACKTLHKQKNSFRRRPYKFFDNMPPTYVPRRCPARFPCEIQKFCKEKKK